MSSFNLSPSDAYVTSVQGPLTTQDSRPIDYAERVEQINEEVFKDLRTFHDKSAVTGYFQSHPFSQIFTNYGLAVDEATLNNNYMRLIFGGKPDPVRDNIHAAYDYVLKQRADDPIVNTPTLNTINPSDFVEGEQSTKDSILETFKKGREYWRGVIDTDTMRALKQRPTHDLIHTTFYNSRVGQNGDSLRYNKIVGQYGHLQYRPDTRNFTPYENLSSKTYAPDGKGGEIPLNQEVEFGTDPRSVPVTSTSRFASSEPKGVYNMNDVGNYAGREIDRYVQDFVDKNASMESLFRTAGQRRWI